MQSAGAMASLGLAKRHLLLNGEIIHNQVAFCNPTLCIFFLLDHSDFKARCINKPASAITLHST